MTETILEDFSSLIIVKVLLEHPMYLSICKIRTKLSFSTDNFQLFLIPYPHSKFHQIYKITLLPQPI